MAVTKSDFEVASDAFSSNATPQNAAMFFSKAREAEENGELDDDDWLNACADIEAYLWELASQADAKALQKRMLAGS